jgi:hypothetical protein
MTPEGAILKCIMDYLAAKHIFALRMNTGAMQIEKRFMRFGIPGQADILAFLPCGVDARGRWSECVVPTWIEVKTPKGVQSALQKSFQQLVVERGHIYILARSIDDVKAAL